MDACNDKNCTCPACVNHFTSQSARRVSNIYRRIGEISGLRVGFLAIVLTLPQQLWIDDKDTLSKIRKAAREVLKRWIARVNDLPLETRRPGWTITGIDVMHPEGDKDPGVWKPHIHVQVPAVAWFKPAGELDDRPSWRTIRMKVSKDDLFWLRCMWGEALMSLGWQPGHTYNGSPQVWKCNVHHHWFSGGDGKQTQAEFHHRIRYDFRHWPGYDGKIRKAQWWGYAAPARQPKAGIQKIRDPNAQAPEPSKDPNCCPKCGALAEWSADVGRNPEKLRRKKARLKIFELVGAPAWVAETRRVRWIETPPLRLFMNWRH